MKTALLIGGRNDGKRMDVEPGISSLGTLCVPVTPKPGEIHRWSHPVEFYPLDIERYRESLLPGVWVIEGHPSFRNPRALFEMLVEGYRKPVDEFSEARR